jgi:hypothetical protein
VGHRLGRGHIGTLYWRPMDREGGFNPRAGVMPCRHRRGGRA